MKDEDFRALVEYRLRQSNNALIDAQTLVDASGSPEGIINRSYYAMFYAVLALAQRFEKIPAKHSGIIGLFDREFHRRGVFPNAFSQDLHRAFELRQKSDYREMAAISQDEALQTLERSRQFVLAIETYLGDEGA